MQNSEIDDEHAVYFHNVLQKEVPKQRNNLAVQPRHRPASNLIPPQELLNHRELLPSSNPLSFQLV